MGVGLEHGGIADILVDRLDWVYLAADAELVGVGARALARFAALAALPRAKHGALVPHLDVSVWEWPGTGGAVRIAQLSGNERRWGRG